MKLMHLSLFVCACLLSFMLQAQEVTTLPDWDVQPEILTQLNSSNRDVNISITPNGKYLYFMSGRGGMPWSNNSYLTFRGQQEADGDLWYSKRVNDKWQAPQCVGQPISTSMGEDEPNISADGQTVYFQSWKSGWSSGGGPYYKAELNGNRWGTPKGLGGGINAFFSRNWYGTDGMSISPDGKTFVVAAGADYDGNLDIYISHKQADGTWSEVKKLDISTEYDERSVYIAADNKTLYFGSSGYGGFGKLDIFKTTLEGGTSCGPIINIGAPFNTTENDYGFVIDAIRNTAYFVRNGDIYQANLGKDIDERIKPQPVVVIDGTVKDPDGKGVGANIEVTKREDNTPIAKARSNALTGEYSLTFPKQEGVFTQKIEITEDYTIEKELVINEETAIFQEQEVMIEPKRMEPEVKEEKTLTVKAPPAPKAMNKVVYFGFDEHSLDTEAKATLESMATTLKGATSYQLRLSGHTDAVGTDAYNMRLSQKRCEAVEAFLKEQGLKEKIAVKAEGESVPAAENDSAANRAKNRRVELEVDYVE